MSSSSRILQTLQRVELLLEEFLLRRDRVSIVSVLSCRRLMSAPESNSIYFLGVPFSGELIHLLLLPL